MSTATSSATDTETVTARHLIGFFSMVVGMFMAILDIQIVAASLSEIQAGLSASQDEIVWVQNSYLIAEVIMIPFSGYVSRALGVRWTFIISSAGFTLASFACAFAQNMDQMIVTRVVQGFIGGAMIPTVFTAAYTMMPRSRQASTTVMIGLVATLAPTIGPSLGGWLTETLSWHWLFLVNIIPGLAITVLVYLCLEKEDLHLDLIRRLDVLGFVLMAVFLGCLDFVLEDGARNDWFSDEAIMVCAVIAGIAGIGFFWRTLSVANPIVDLGAFSDRNFAMGCLFSFTLGITLYGLVYLQPQFLARVRGHNSLQIGQIMLVTGAAQFLSAPLVGSISRKVDPRIMLAIGFSMICTSNFMLSNLNGDWDYNEFFVPQVLRGMGFMFAIIPANVLALGTLSPDRVKNASGLYNLMRNLGGAFGLAGITTMLDKREALHWMRLGSHMDPSRPEMQSTYDNLVQYFSQFPNLDPQSAALRTLGNMVYQQTQVMSFMDIFWLMGWIALSAVFVVLMARKPQPTGASGH